MLNIKNLGDKAASQDIQHSIFNLFGDHRYKIFNSFIFEWESDFLSIADETNYVYEVEIKVSKNDFKKDFKKEDKHVLLESSYKTNKEKIEPTLSKVLPNKFFYACPRNTITSFGIPEYAGFIEISESETGFSANIVKNAPFLHKQNIFDIIKPLFLDKFYHKYVRTEFENYELQKKIKLLEEQIKKLNK